MFKTPSVQDVFEDLLAKGFIAISGIHDGECVYAITQAGLDAYGHTAEWEPSPCTTKELAAASALLEELGRAGITITLDGRALIPKCSDPNVRDADLMALVGESIESHRHALLTILHPAS